MSSSGDRFPAANEVQANSEQVNSHYSDDTHEDEQRRQNEEELAKTAKKGTTRERPSKGKKGEEGGEGERKEDFSLDLDDVPEEARALLDPCNEECGPLELDEWDDDRREKLIDSLKPQHLAVLIAKRIHSEVLPRSNMLSWHHLTFKDGDDVVYDDLNGCLEPGQFLGILGGPDSGLTPFLSTLASVQDQTSGEVLYHSKKRTKEFKRSVGYTPKTDNHMALLTVYETLWFSGRMRLPAEISDRIVHTRVEMVMKFLGLSATRDSQVGSATVRGISGGEKRRLSFGCEFVAGHSVLLADLPTNGLDAATARSLLTIMKHGCAGGLSFLASLVQPSVELFRMLDSVIVLSKGKTIYFGPPDEAEEYFNKIGFFRPESKAIPQFLEELSSRPEAFWRKNKDNDLDGDDNNENENGDNNDKNNATDETDQHDGAAHGDGDERQQDSRRDDGDKRAASRSADKSNEGDRKKSSGSNKKKSKKGDEDPKAATESWIDCLPDTERRRAWEVLYHAWEESDYNKKLMEKVEKVKKGEYDSGKEDPLEHIADMQKRQNGNGENDNDHEKENGHASQHQFSSETREDDEQNGDEENGIGAHKLHPAAYEPGEQGAQTPSSKKRGSSQREKEEYEEYCKHGTPRKDFKKKRSKGSNGDKFKAQQEDGTMVHLRIKHSRWMNNWYRRYPSSPWQQLKTNIWRQWLLTFRNTGLWRDIWMISCAIGLIVGSLFTQFNINQPNSTFRSSTGFTAEDGARNIVGMWFFVISYIGFNAVQLVPVLAQQRTVFYEQKEAQYHQAAPYFFSLVVMNVPIALVEALLLLIPLWGLSIAPNLQYDSTWGETFISPVFWYCLLLLFLTSIVCRVWMMLLWSISPNEVVADVLNQVTNILMTKLAGYFVPRSDIVSGWIWMYFMSFYTWSLEGLSVATVRPLVKQCTPTPDDTCRFTNGYDALKVLYDMSPGRWLWWYIFFEIFFFIGFCFAAYLGYWLLDFTPVDVPEYPDWAEEAEQEAKEEEEKKQQKQGGSGDSGQPRGMKEHSNGKKHAHKRNVRYREDLAWYERAMVVMKIKRPPPRRTEYSDIVVSGHKDDASEKHTHYHGGHRVKHAESEGVSDDESDDSNEKSQSGSGKDKEKKKGGPDKSQGIVIEWKKLKYTVAGDKVLLNNVFGYSKPGMMVALIGATGSGKSTLLDVLANKKTSGKITGTLLVNGKPRDKNFAHIAGYVEQFDSHEPYSTVKEAIEFAGRLRLPRETTSEELSKKVDTVLKQLGLKHLSDRIIGGGEVGGVSQEVRKKVTIAIELIFEPKLLFLDEPTTGLDSAAAYAVMSSVRELAKTITVICTIHQPPAEVANLFDYMLALKPGGRVAYFGPVKSLPVYFASNLLGKPRKDKNIADFALEQIKKFDDPKKQGTDDNGGDDEGSDDKQDKQNEGDKDESSEKKPKKEMKEATGDEDEEDEERFLGDDETIEDYERDGQVDIAAIFAKSKLGKKAVDELNKGIWKTVKGDLKRSGEKAKGEGGDDNENGDVSIDVNDDDDDGGDGGGDSEDTGGGTADYAEPLTAFWTQTWVLTDRFFKATIRNHLVLGTRMFLALFMGFIVATVFFLERNQQRSVEQRTSAIFVTLLFIMFTANQFMPDIYAQRPMYFREVTAAMYRPGPYYIARYLSDIPFVIIENLILALLVFYPVLMEPSLNGANFILLLVAFIGVRYAAICCTYALGFLIELSNNANTLQATYFNLLFAFSGFLITTPFIPWWWLWFSDINFLYWGLHFAVADNMRFQTFTCNADVPPGLDNSWLIPVDSTYSLCPLEPRPNAPLIAPGAPPGQTWYLKCFYACGMDVMKYFGVLYDDAWMAGQMGILWVIAIVFAVVGYLALKFVNHIKR